MSNEIHLVVLVHGLWGTIRHFDYIANQLNIKQNAIIHDLPDDPLNLPSSASSHTVVYRTHSNEGYFTYDGVDVCGVRVANEIENELNALNSYPDTRVTKISIAGYSLGGLISRYAIGLLYKRGIFDNIKPVSYTTFCSPHVGVVVLGNRFSARSFNWVGQYSMSSTSRQLFLSDKYQSTNVPLLEYMSDHESPFYKGLSLFPSITLYANVINDHRCEYYTSAIETKDPFTGRVRLSVGPYVEGYEPTVLDIITEGGALFEDPSKSEEQQLPTGLFSKLKALVTRPINYTLLAIRILVIVPLWFVAFLINAGYQAIASSSRQRSFRKSDEHLSLLYDNEGPTMSEILEDEADDVVESMYKTFKRQPEEEEPLIRRDTSSSSGPSSVALGEDLPLKKTHRKIIKNLNALNWNKFPVHIRLAAHSHAAVIVRFRNEKFAEGKTVINHWIDTTQW